MHSPHRDRPGRPPPREWKFRALSCAVGEAVICLDRRGRVCEWNAAAESLFGYSAGEASGRELFRLLGGGAARMVESRPTRGRGDGMAAEQFGFLARCKDGRRQQVEMLLLGGGAESGGQVLVVIPYPTAGTPPGKEAAGQNEVDAFIRRQQQDGHLIWQLMHHDPLTGLPNRLLMLEHLARTTAQSARLGRRVAVLVVNIGQFKYINDTLGHAVGDFLLTTVAGRLRSEVDPSGGVGRLDGAEFAIVLPNLVHGGEAETAARDLLASIAAPIDVAGHEIVLNASLGIAIFPDDGSDPEALVRNAGAAMCLAKREDGNGWRLYAAEFNAFAMARLALEEDLRRALGRNELEIYYQPQIDAHGGRIDGAEALLRWHRPGHGLVPPADFIPLAEETGLIVPIGDWVLEAACRQLGAWRAAGAADLRVAVNLSARQFRRSDLAFSVPDIVRRTGIPAASLELEITESMLMHDVDAGSAMLKELHRQGVRMAIDDFGTGYSSLNYLKRFPIDTLKIDRSFIQHVPHDDSDIAIVQTVIALAHGLRLEVVAEGVETRAQFEFLRELGCDKIQGYFFSRPVDAAGFEALLADGLPGGGESRPA